MAMTTDILPEWLQSTEGGDPADIEQSTSATLLVSGLSLAAGIATKYCMEGLWRALRKDDPPLNPAAPDVTWTDALTWAAAVGAAMGVSKVLSRRGVTAAWRKAHS